MNNNVQQKLAEFFSKYKEVKYKKKELIHFAGEVPSQVFYIKEGYVRGYGSVVDGKEFTNRIYKPGQFFSFLSVWTDDPTLHTYESITDVIIMRAPNEEFLEFLKKNVDILFELLKIYLLRLNKTLKKLETIITGSASIKILMAISFLADQIGNIKEGKDIIFPIGLTHQELAGLTGLTRETVTLELDELKKQGLIYQDKKIIHIADLERIKKIIG